MFHWDCGLKLTKPDLAVDFRRRQPRGFISHAHTDHMARHELAYCTPQTAKLYHLRLGQRPVHELPYRSPYELAAVRLTTFPAGHCLGSAMLLAEDGDRSLLYTGDFKLGAALTAAPAELPHADVLVIESTFGQPQYRRAPRAVVIEQLLEIVAAALADDATPVVEAYALGKAQEVTRILTDAGFSVLQHPDIAAVSRTYEACGVSLGDYTELCGHVPPGRVLVVPPHKHRAAGVCNLRRSVTIAVTGWAQDRAAKYRLGVDYAVPLSDHADYDELWEAIERVAPREIHCTHGPESFVDRLREGGLNAYVLGRAEQRRLF